jgi:hypothetical protein
MWKKPATLIAMLRAKSSSVNSMNGLERKTPALLTSVSMRPKRSSAVLTMRWAVSGSPMSPATASMSGSAPGLIDRELATTR